MSKRGAGSELNHDNWDQEEEPEEAGEFRKASSQQMKGRVIKKARRRNLNEDEKKNVFAGFGGFSSTAKDPKEAFSFLGNTTTNGAASGGFSFLSNLSKTGEVSKTTENVTESKTSGFTFGSKGNSPGDKLGLNDDSKESDGKAEKENQTPANNSSNDLFSKFKPAAGTWSCDVCMISNGGEKDKCAACETPKPGAQVKSTDIPTSTSTAVNGGFKFGVSSQTIDKNGSNASKPVDDLFSKFKPAAGAWSCDVCMISNNGDNDKCIACETPKPGSAVKPSVNETKSFSFGDNGGFKFGGSSQSESSSGFKFGVSDSSTSSTASSGFKFEATDEKSANVTKASTGFKFGTSIASAEKTEESKLCPSDTPKDSGALAGFKFGSTTGDSAFKFGSVGTKTAVELSSASDTPRTKTKKDEYLSNLKTLNVQVTSWIKSHVDDNPLVDLTPVFVDYEKHIGELKTKFNVQASLSTAQKKTLQFDQDNSDTSGRSGNNEAKPFSFGESQAIGGNTSSGFGTCAASPFQFGFLQSDKNEQSKEEEISTSRREDGETLSPKQAVETVVESDSLYSKKCKLFYKKSGSYEERGVGNIHLKKTDESKLQVLIRADTSLGNILLNIILNDNMPVERVGKNNVMLICVPNPPIDPKAESEPVTFLIRVKSGEDADTLKDKMKELCQS